MKNVLDRYNFTSQEKRLVVGIAFVLFVVINIWFVWPHFSDWSDLQEDLRKTRLKLGAAKLEIEKVKGPSGYAANLKRLESEGDAVLPEDQSIQFQISVDRIARQSGVAPTSVGAVADSSDTAASKFFVEKSLNIGYENTEEKALVNFLYNLGTKSSMFRVKDLEIRPSVGQYRLSGRVTIIASYLKDLAKPVAGSPATNKVVFVKKPGAITNKAPGTVNKPGSLPANRGPLPITPPGGRSITGGKPMTGQTNSHPTRLPSPASKQ